MKALQDVRVLDLTRLLPGPYCSMILADFGAEVIKVEQPGEGDYARSYPPLRNGMGYRYIMLNRNKKSITIDLKTDKGKEIFFRLAKDADVVMESFRPGVMKRLGIDYGSIKAINPKLIFCSLTGFGQTGKYKLSAGHDINYVSLAGIISLTGERDGKPYIPGIQIADISGGLMAALGIMIALNSRHLTGTGQCVDVSLFNAALAMMPTDASLYFGNGQIPQRGESRLIGGLPNYYIYRTKDGRYMAVGALEKKFWVNLCRVLEREDLVDAIDDKKNHPALFIAMDEIFAGKTLQEWEKILDGKDTCVTPVKNLDEVFDDSHVKANEMVLKVTDEKLGVHRHLGIPIKLSDTPGSLMSRAPDLGEHSEEILGVAGYSPEEIQDFRAQKIV